MSALHLVRSPYLKLSALKFRCDFSQRYELDIVCLRNLTYKAFDGRKIADVFRMVCQNDWDFAQARFTRAYPDG